MGCFGSKQSVHLPLSHVRPSVHYPRLPRPPILPILPSFPTIPTYQAHPSSLNASRLNTDTSPQYRPANHLLPPRKITTHHPGPPRDVVRALRPQCRHAPALGAVHARPEILRDELRPDVDGRDGQGAESGWDACDVCVWGFGEALREVARCVLMGMTWCLCPG